MTHLQISVLGRSMVRVDGHPAKLTPTATAVLLRLLVANSKLVSTEQIFNDVWRTSRPSRREDRVSVQKRISELRSVLDPNAPAAMSQLLTTERGRVSAYRLTLHPEQVDMFTFRALVERAQHTDPAATTELLHAALALWQHRPLFDAEGFPFAERAIEQLHDLHRTARRRLLDAYRAMEMVTDMVRLSTEILEDDPGDTEVAQHLRHAREGMTLTRNVALRHELPQARSAIVITVGDLLEQHDAHLVVGVSDTFDTSIERNQVINAGSLQGQLMTRLYAGDRERLDRELRRALDGVPKAGTEARTEKRYGKLLRYPVGTVAALSHEQRRIFLVAYSRMGNDLIARSSREVLAESLQELWQSIRLHGQLGVVALPVLGSGLARIEGATDAQLLQMIISSFVDEANRGPLCRELRIVIRPGKLAGMLHEVAAFVRAM